MLKDFWHLIVPPDVPLVQKINIKQPDKKKEIEDLESDKNTIGIIVVVSILIDLILLGASKVNYQYFINNDQFAIMILLGLFTGQ